MSKKKPVTSEIHDIAHLPQGYVPLTSLCTSTGATPLYGYIDRAFHRGELRHGRFKCAHKLFIHEEDLKRCREDFENKPEKQPPQHNTRGTKCSISQIQAACESLASIDTTLDEIYLVLERLTAAVESIATQPKTTQQELLYTTNGNGFHS
jgi:hypothetical protein